MNNLLHDNCIAVHGIENALKVAKTLLEQDYQVFIQLDDCDVYIVDYAENNLELGADRFALVSLEEVDKIIADRETKKFEAAKHLIEDTELNKLHDNISELIGR